MHTRCRGVLVIGDREGRVIDEELKSFAKMAMEQYLSSRENLLKVVLLVDIRHAPSKQDVEMYGYLRHYGLDGIVVATKADKISRNQLQKQIKIIKQALGLGEDDIVIPVSALKKTGCEELLDLMETLLQG